ncbi:hypothetical protein U1Q18_022709 [Sarracenia purpurea var. burkii]
MKNPEASGLRLMFLAKQNAQRAPTREASGDTKAGEERRQGEEEDGEPDHASATSHGHRHQPHFGTPPPGSVATSERDATAPNMQAKPDRERDRGEGKRPAPPPASPDTADEGKEEGEKRVDVTTGQK